MGVCNHTWGQQNARETGINEDRNRRDGEAEQVPDDYQGAGNAYFQHLQVQICSLPLSFFLLLKSRFQEHRLKSQSFMARSNILHSILFLVMLK